MQQHWLKLCIVSRGVEAEGIIAIVLAAPDGGPLPHFSAGSHVDVEIAPDLVRQYSLCSTPAARDRYEIAVLRDPASRGGSTEIHERFAEGDTLRVSEPRNHFPLYPVRGEALLIAGGIGVTPLLCMAERLSAIGAPFALHYCTRSAARTAFRDRIAASGFADRVQYHFDDGPDAQRLDPASLFSGAIAEVDVYVCGPAGFIDWICAAAGSAGIAPQHLHREYFSAAPIEPAPGGDRPFLLRLASNGQMIEVAAEESAAAALARHGIEVSVSCEQGICGTCITRVIEGQPDHRDMLMIDGNAEFTPCCSRSHSPVLVIDL
ncbi:oxidoreductase [Sphingomonas sp. So64.6b]|uniref:PDR/VanB family oxidoreductase n=1 Tax=Sphingomonas sp. So64.6b TaxID=2997354 RepID=UPI0016045087|nr:PDR/VanB family oxidoreductase [Sphingomonas sp. So64.6b]QNA86555.1 oxidoreductase [Sphingomonas sp. So64.6b]